MPSASERGGHPVPLVVNADDYALTERVSRGILRAHREGIVSSTSILAVAPAFEMTVRWLGDAPQLGVGVHLALVGEDPPLITAGAIPTLVDRSGRFAASWRAFLLRAAAGRIDPEDVERELAAQIERVLAANVAITHLDSHQHLHLWPLVGEVTLRLARRFGIRAVRVPRSRGRRLAGIGVNLLARRLSRRAEEEGLAFPRAVAGFDEAGRMDLSTLIASLEGLGQLRRGPAELFVHPGEPDDPDLSRYAWGYRWPDELAALVDPRARKAVIDLGFELSTYASAAKR